MRQPSKSEFSQYGSPPSSRVHRGSSSSSNSEIFFENLRNIFSISLPEVCLKIILSILFFLLKYANYVAETALHVEIVKMITLIFASLKLLKSLTRTKIERRVVLIAKALNPLYIVQLLCVLFANPKPS